MTLAPTTDATVVLLDQAEAQRLTAESIVVATEPTSLVAAERQCAAIEAWSETCDDVGELLDTRNKCAAMREYLRLTSIEGRARITATERRLEVRVGVLLGPARQPSETGRGRTVDRDHEMDSATVAHFRRMAADPETVEAVIAASTDAKPPSRRKVMDAIKAKRRRTGEPPKHRSRAAVADRVDKAKRMAAEGYTSRQIAEAIGMTPGSFIDFKKRHEMTVPADAVVGKTQRHDANRLVAETVHTLEGAAMTIDLLGDPRSVELDPDRIDGWVTSLRSSLTVLTQFSKQLKEMTQ